LFQLYGGRPAADECDGWRISERVKLQDKVIRRCRFSTRRCLGQEAAFTVGGLWENARFISSMNGLRIRSEFRKIFYFRLLRAQSKTIIVITTMTATTTLLIGFWFEGGELRKMLSWRSIGVEFAAAIIHRDKLSRAQMLVTWSTR
jgi:hypothetical protein